MYNKSVARRIMKKDHDAFRILYDDWAELLYAYAYDILGSPVLAAQTLRETFCRAYDTAQELKDETQLEPWLRGICTAQCAKAAACRRTLPEAEKEKLWADIAETSGIRTMEVQAQPQEAKEGKDDWQPIIFLPEDEDIQQHPPLPAAAREEPAKEESKEESKEETEEKPRRARPARKAAAAAAGALLLVGMAVAGGAAVLALAGAGVLQLPASLSGAGLLGVL